jgi:ATP-dependent Clp protease ATP-binding subunit ClpA
VKFECFTGDARAAVAGAQEDARRLGHRYVGCEHLLLAAVSAGGPAAAALRQHGVTPEAVEAEIVRLVGLGQPASLFNALDREALAAVGIDLDAVRARVEAAFGPDAFTRPAPAACRDRPAWPKTPMTRLLRRRPRSRAAGPDASPGAYPTGHLPFTPRAKKSLQRSVREALQLGQSYIGVEHLTLALLAMDQGAVPPILSALGASRQPCGPPFSAVTGRPADTAQKPPDPAAEALAGPPVPRTQEVGIGMAARVIGCCSSGAGPRLCP